MKHLCRNLALLVTFVVLACGLAFVVTKFDVQVHKVATGSMSPTLPVGSLVVTSRADSLEKRDIITFVSEKSGKTTTHTFIGYDKQGNLLTKGDANPTPDIHIPPLHHSDVVGEVRFHVDVFTVDFWTTPRGVALAICLLVFTLLAFTGKREEESEVREQAKEPATNSA